MTGPELDCRVHSLWRRKRNSGRNLSILVAGQTWFGGIAAVKVSEDSGARLVLKDQSVWIAAVCGLAALFPVSQILLGRAPTSMYILAGFFVLFALVFLRRSRIEFDKSARRVSIDKLQVFKRRSARLAFDDISDVLIETEPLSAAERAPPCRLSLVTTQGALPLTDSYQSDYAHHSVMRHAILQALGRPVSDAMDESLRQLVRAGRSVDAVAMLRLQKKMDLTAARLKVAELEQQLRSGG